MELCRAWSGVCLVPVPNYQQKHVGTCLDVVTMKRYREEVRFRSVLTPVAYQDSVICYQNCTRQRFRSSAQYEPKSKPKIFHESVVIYPSRTEMTFVSTVDYHIDECRKWFHTSMEFKAKTYTTTKIQNVNNTNINNFNNNNDKEIYDDSNGTSNNNDPCRNTNINDYWDNISSSCCDSALSSPDASSWVNSDHETKKVDYVSNGPGASLIYLPRFEREDHINSSCNFDLVVMDSENQKKMLILEDCCSDDEVDI